MKREARVVGINGGISAGKDASAVYIRDQFSFAHLAFADPIKRYCRDAFDFSVSQLWGPSAERNAPDQRYPRKHGPWVPKGWHNVACACCGLVIDDRQVLTDALTSLPQCYLTPRFALQRLGTEWGRDCYNDVWAVKGVRDALKLLEGKHVYNATLGLVSSQVDVDCRGVVISDVRFKNEMDVIKRNNGLLVRVKRPNMAAATTDPTHRSEAELADVPDELFDAIIENDSTLENLYTQLHAFTEKYACPVLSR